MPRPPARSFPRKTAWRTIFSAALLSAACGGPVDSGPPLGAHTADPAGDNGGDMWGSTYFPNVELQTHRGETVRFFDDLVKDKVVAINFIYTSCPDACPMETARLLEVQRILGDRMGKDVHFYSISIDPEHDTPVVLGAYVDKWALGPGWTFLTGKKEDIKALQKKLGVYNGEFEQIVANKSAHKLTLVIGNQATGRWMKRSPYENPYVLANQIGSWLHNWRLPSAGGQDYAEAPKLRSIGAGENLFRTRCASCHTIGEGATARPEERRVGPDLYNISAQREREWLTRWMMAPDAVVAAGDPLALALVEASGGMVMPNLRLTEVDVENVLQFIDEESARLDAALSERAHDAPEPAAATDAGSEAGTGAAADSGEKKPCH
jgi:protein SCO1/2